MFAFSVTYCPKVVVYLSVFHGNFWSLFTEESQTWHSCAYHQEYIWPWPFDVARIAKTVCFVCLFVLLTLHNSILYEEFLQFMPIIFCLGVSLGFWKTNTCNMCKTNDDWPATSNTFLTINKTKNKSTKVKLGPKNKATNETRVKQLQGKQMWPNYVLKKSIQRKLTECTHFLYPKLHRRRRL